MTRGRPKNDERQVTMDAPDYVVGFAAEDIPEEDCVVDTEMSSVESVGGIYGTFQITCNELGPCETRELLAIHPVPVINKCLRCPKLGVKLAR